MFPYQLTLQLSMSRLSLHVDVRPGIQERTKIFGHKNSIIHFREGIVAKKFDIREYNFYQTNMTELNGFFDGYIPEFLNIAKILTPSLNEKNDISGNEEIKFETFIPGAYDSLGQTVDDLYIIQKDISSGFKKTAILDLKVGTRSWRLNASQKKADRRTKKIQRGPNGILKFRVRGAIYYNSDNLIETVHRDFSDKCTMKELQNFIESFFKHTNQITSMVEKLEKLKLLIIEAEEKYGIRFYSSSIVFMYDENDTSKFDLRLLDFEKAYVHIEREARECNVPLEECDDGLADAITNIVYILNKLI